MSEDRPLGDIRKLVVGTVVESLEAFLNLCRDQTACYKLFSSDDIKDVACRRFPGKTTWRAVEVMIPKDPYRYRFWLEQVNGHLRIVGVERLTSARRASN